MKAEETDFEHKSTSAANYYSNMVDMDKVKKNWLRTFVWQRLVSKIALKVDWTNHESTVNIDSYHGVMREAVLDELSMVLNQKPFYFKVYFRNPFRMNFKDNDMNFDPTRLEKLNLYLKV